MRTYRRLIVAMTVVVGMTTQQHLVSAGVIDVTNGGFEDTRGQRVFNEFTFGSPAGWNLYDPNGIVGNPGVFTGTLQPNGVDFFNTLAPEGTRVAILFNAQSEGAGEYGFEQTLTATLQSNTDYELSVEVGNIASGVATNGTFFDLDEFPGYRVELLAGGVVIASDDNGLLIPEAEFATSTVTFQTGALHPLLGQPLGIRLVNENIIPPGFTQQSSPDLEVDFDDVRLVANPIEQTPVPEPSSGYIFAIGLMMLLWIGRRW